jgi:hypothetical protein
MTPAAAIPSLSDIPFDALVTFFVLLIGLPAVVLQSLPAEIRRVLEKRRALLARDLGLPILIAISTAAATVTVHRFGVWSDGPVWSIGLGMLALICIATALIIPRRYGQRDAVVQLLAGESAWELDGTGRLQEDPLHDLVEFGRRSEPVREKLSSLEALRALTDRVCEHPDYVGDALTDLIDGVVAIVVEARGAGRTQLVPPALAVLRRAVRAFDPTKAGHTDASSAIHGMSVMGIESLRMGNTSVTQTITQSLGWSRGKDRALTMSRSQALFEVGMAAIERNEMLAALKVLDGLTSLIYANAPAEGELARDTIGLFAHFWTSGETGKQFARFRMSQLEDFFKRDIAAVVDATIEHCQRRALFETADKVRAMRRELAEPSGAGMIEGAGG